MVVIESSDLGSREEVPVEQFVADCPGSEQDHTLTERRLGSLDSVEGSLLAEGSHGCDSHTITDHQGLKIRTGTTGVPGVVGTFKAESFSLACTNTGVLGSFSICLWMSDTKALKSPGLSPMFRQDTAMPMRFGETTFEVQIV